MQHPNTLLFYDGHCALCQSSVKWVLRHDRHQRIHFAALQSPLAKRLLAQNTLPDSIILWHQGRLFVESDAVFQLLRLMGGMGSALAWLRIVPRFIRNPVYRWVARNRYRWFGRHDSCMLLLPEYRSRFVD